MSRIKIQSLCTVAVAIVALGGGPGGLPYAAAQGDIFADTVTITNEKDEERRLILYAHNSLPFPIYAHFAEVRAQNYRSSVSLPRSFIIPPQASRHRLLHFEIVDRDKGSIIRYRHTFSFSDPKKARHKDRHRYLFPYDHGEKFSVGQSHNGRYSHNDDANRYAIDLTMDIGTPVHAARDGFVVFIKEDSNIGGAGSRYGDHANIIIIMHKDGSLASYVHLQQNGAEVEIGQQVRAGERIGRSGNTGNSSGPHLHFDVQVPNKQAKLISVPVVFSSLKEEVKKPEVGEYYYSSHPGKPPFEVALGRILTVESFDGYLKSIEITNSVDWRSERIDSTFVAFCSNGTIDDVTVEVDFETDGLSAELDYPLRIDIPAKSEIFCGLFQPQKKNRGYRLTPSFSLIKHVIE